MPQSWRAAWRGSKKRWQRKRRNSNSKSRSPPNTSTLLRRSALCTSMPFAPNSNFLKKVRIIRFPARSSLRATLMGLLCRIVLFSLQTRIIAARSTAYGPCSNLQPIKYQFFSKHLRAAACSRLSLWRKQQAISSARATRRTARAAVLARGVVHLCVTVRAEPA